MAETNLKELISLDFENLKREFKIASIEGGGNPQEISDRNEKSVRELLKKYLLRSTKVDKGVIRDSFGESSKQFDAVILSPFHPDLQRSESISFILADDVTCGIEIKSTLKKDTLEDSLEKITTIKNLKLQDNKNLKYGYLFQELDDWNSEIDSHIPAGILCSNLECKTTVIEIIFDYYKKNNIPTSKWVDFIVSLDGFMLTTFGYGHVLSPLNKSVGVDGRISKTIITSMDYKEKYSEYFLYVILYICNNYRNNVLGNNNLVYYIDNFSSEKLTNEDFQNNSMIFSSKEVNKSKIDEYPDQFLKLSESNFSW